MNESRTEADAVADLARRGPAVEPIDAGGLFAVRRRSDELVDVLDLEKYAPAPSRKRGGVNVHTPAGLITYANRHMDPSASTLWHDPARGQICVVLNDHVHTAAQPGWGDHRVTLNLRRSERWKAWVELSEKPMTQTAFAEFLEEHVADIVEPDGAALLEVARSLQVTTGAKFRSARSLHSGETQLVYEEEVEARAGKGGDITVPRNFAVALEPWEGSPPWRVDGRFFYRAKEGMLAVGYKLLRLAEIARDASDAIASSIHDALDLPVIEGIAPEARR